MWGVSLLPPSPVRPRPQLMEVVESPGLHSATEHQQLQEGGGGVLGCGVRGGGRNGGSGSVPSSKVTGERVLNFVRLPNARAKKITLGGGA